MSTKPALLLGFSLVVMVRAMTEGIVNRFLSSAKAEMLQKNETEIRCPCRRCKLKSLIADPDSGQVRDQIGRASCRERV